MICYDGIFFDELTRLPYDRYFVRQAHELIRNQLKRPVMISLDISNFKYFNRMYGYREGDRLISRMVECFCHNNADCVLAYRIYVDHIIMLIEAEGLPEKVFKAKYSDMLSRFSEKTNMEFPLARIRLYLGAYYVEDRDEDIGIIIDKSQYARRSIKKNYLTGIAIFRADMEKKAVDEAKIIPMFYSALENDRIEVYIQPKFSIDDERLIGGEALSRIMDNDGNIISPGMYIDILERTNLISKLDGYVIRKLIAIQKKWMDEGRPLTTISLNLSRVDLLEQGFVDGIHQAIVESGVPSGYFEFELTETVFCENITEITKQIDFLKEKGYKISMDDFGSGYNSLYMLGKIPVDIIKFDRGFVLNSLHGETGRTIMKNLIHTFTDVDFEIICEGIEIERKKASCTAADVMQYRAIFMINHYHIIFLLTNIYWQLMMIKGGELIWQEEAVAEATQEEVLEEAVQAEALAAADVQAVSAEDVQVVSVEDFQEVQATVHHITEVQEARITDGRQEGCTMVRVVHHHADVCLVSLYLR